jgi:hypothetical protein
VRPLHHVSQHVVKPECVGFLLADRVRGKLVNRPGAELM